MTVYREGHTGIRRAPTGVARVPAGRRVEAVPIRADDQAPRQRWQHGSDLAAPVAPRMPSMVARGVQALRNTVVDEGPPKRFLIGEAEVVAAGRFYVDYVRGVEGVREPSLELRSGSADVHAVAFARTKAVARHREIAETLGPAMTAWLVSFIVSDLSFVAMADRYWPGDQGRKEIKGGMVTLLVLLSRLYAALDRRRKRRAP